MFDKRKTGTNPDDKTEAKTQFVDEVSIRHLIHKRLRRRRILNVGCGVSTSLPQFLHGNEATYHLVDHDKAKVEAMRLSLRALRLPREISRGDITQLEFENKSFDYVLERKVLRGISDPAQGIRECMRVAWKAAIFLEVDWSTFEWEDDWLGEFYVTYRDFMKARKSDLSFGHRIVGLLPTGSRYSETPYGRSHDNHERLIVSICESILGQIRSEPAPDLSLIKFFEDCARRARQEGAWVTPATMNVVEVKTCGIGS